MASVERDSWAPHKPLITGGKMVGGLNWEGGEAVVVLPEEGSSLHNRSFYITTVAVDLLQPERFASANLILEKGYWHDQ